ncbi:MAG: hypothetical protein Q4G67_07935 [Actinomycetia bacterium]|nr:hypothetical protein [Actinomycetes bacterium]
MPGPARRPDSGAVPDPSRRDPMRGSPTLRSFGIACLVIGVLGLAVIGGLLLWTDITWVGGVWLIPLAFLLLGALFVWQARRRAGTQPPSR